MENISSSIISFCLLQMPLTKYCANHRNRRNESHHAFNPQQHGSECGTNGEVDTEQSVEEVDKTKTHEYLRLDVVREAEPYEEYPCKEQQEKENHDDDDVQVVPSQRQVSVFLKKKFSRNVDNILSQPTNQKPKHYCVQLQYKVLTITQTRKGSIKKLKE